MKKIFILFLVLFSSFTKAGDVCDEIASAIRSGDARQIAGYFNASVDLTISSQSDVYSKAQAELLVRDFFSKNPPKSFVLVHKGSSKEGSLFGVGTYTSSSGKIFRTSFVMKTQQGKHVIQELRFEVQ